MIVVAGQVTLRTPDGERELNAAARRRGVPLRLVAAGQTSASDDETVARTARGEL